MVLYLKKHPGVEKWKNYHQSELHSPSGYCVVKDMVGSKWRVNIYIYAVTFKNVETHKDKVVEMKTVSKAAPVLCAVHTKTQGFILKERFEGSSFLCDSAAESRI